MKTMIVTGLLALTLATQVIAADTDRTTRHLERMADRLELDASQRDAFMTTMQAQQEKRRALMEGVQAQMQTLHDETTAQLSGVLTAEQLEALQKHHGKGKHKGMWMDGKKGRHCDQ